MLNLNPYDPYFDRDGLITRIDYDCHIPGIGDQWRVWYRRGNGNRGCRLFNKNDLIFDGNLVFYSNIAQCIRVLLESERQF